MINIKTTQILFLKFLITVMAKRKHDLDLSRRVIVQCDKNVACKSCTKSCAASNPTPLSLKGKGLGIKTVPGRGGGRVGGKSPGGRGGESASANVNARNMRV